MPSEWWKKKNLILTYFLLKNYTILVFTKKMFFIFSVDSIHYQTYDLQEATCIGIPGWSHDPI